MTPGDSLLALGVMAAGAVGAVLRHLVNAWWVHRRPALPRDGVAVVNVIGAFLLGVAVGVLPDGPLLAVCGTGLLGGFTTFSTWLVGAAAAGGRALVRDIVLHLTLGVPAAIVGMAITGRV